MQFNLAGAISKTKLLEVRNVAYYTLMRRLAGGAPCLEKTPRLPYAVLESEEPNFNYEFRLFKIERVK